MRKSRDESIMDPLKSDRPYPPLSDIEKQRAEEVRLSVGGREICWPNAKAVLERGPLVWGDEIAAMCRDSGITREEYMAAMAPFARLMREREDTYSESPEERAMVDETIGAIASLIEETELERAKRELAELRDALESRDG